MTEKLTFSLFAILHGEDEAISETETWEGETKEELVVKLADQLVDMAESLRLEIGR
jgi:hypothetical protein